MARLGSTIAGRITLGVLAMHVLVLPTLYLGLVYLIKENNQEIFLNGSRGHARIIADSLERVADPGETHEITEILDSVVLSGTGVFSQLVGDERTFNSSLVEKSHLHDYRQDFRIGEHGDDVYYIATPVLIGGESFSLRVGFDEAPYVEQNAAAYKNGIIIIAVYLVALLILLPIIGRRVVRPVKALQLASQQIASGGLSENLTVETNLVEFAELSQDLERMKRRLIGINEQLEQQILEREQAETERRNLEQQLRHSQRLETVGTMAGGIAHELNNILVPIILYSEVAIEDLQDNREVREDVERVLRAAKRAKSIVSQVLTFSRKISSGEHVPVDMSQVVRESIDLLRASTPPNLVLDCQLDESCPSVLGDYSLMNQLVLNLCTNAIQSLPQGSGTVTVTLDTTRADAALVQAHPSLRNCELVCLTVKDDGHGMDEATQERIFEPFFTTRTVGEGTGLGLSVVHGIVTDANGAIRVRSAVESGSVFEVYLPAYSAPDAATSRNATRQET